MLSFSEMRGKERRARELMAKLGLDALALSSTANFAWLTCGGSNYVSTASEAGVATAVITRDAKFMVCDNIEAARIAEEEVANQGFEFRTCLWFEGRKDALIREIAGTGTLGSDVPMAGAKHVAADLDPYRFSLLPEETERYRWLGRNTAECLTLAAEQIRPGMTEHEIAAALDAHLLSRGITPTVTLIAADDRISKYRHPIPTDNKLQRCAMLVAGARKWGLIVSATRIVHFGELPTELRRRQDAVMAVDAAFIANTRPGEIVGEVFRRGVEAYRATGFGEEWKLHHQGGPTGYKAREYRAVSEIDAAVLENQAFAWNPSITGAKTEDTIIATSSGPEIISQDDSWPLVEVDVNGTKIRRPDVLVR